MNATHLLFVFLEILFFGVLPQGSEQGGQIVDLHDPVAVEVEQAEGLLQLLDMSVR